MATTTPAANRTHGKIKMREMVLTSRLERLLSKREILELYLNSTYLGRGTAEKV